MLKLLVDSCTRAIALLEPFVAQYDPAIAADADVLARCTLASMQIAIGKLDEAGNALLTKSVKTIVDQVEAMKRLVNEFEIITKVGEGTRITITRWRT